MVVGRHDECPLNEHIEASFLPQHIRHELQNIEGLLSAVLHYMLTKKHKHNLTRNAQK